MAAFWMFTSYNKLVAEKYLNKLRLNGKDADVLRPLSSEVFILAQKELATSGTSGVSAGNLGPVRDGVLLENVPLDAIERGSAAPGFGTGHTLGISFVFGNLDEEFHGCGPRA